MPATAGTGAVAIDRRTIDRRTAALALPALGALAAEPLYVLVDTIIVGHLGKVPLGGLAVASSALTSTAWLFAFLNNVTATRVAQARGADSPARIGDAVRHALVLAIGLGVLVAAALGALAPVIARIYGPANDVQAAAVTYLRISSVGIGALYVSFVGIGWLNGMGRTRQTLAVVAIANVANLALEVVLVYGFHTGLAGSAWGTVIAQWAQAAMLMVLAGRGGVLGSFASVSGRELRRMLANGLRLGTRTATIVGVFAVSVALAARLGTRQLAAHQIGDKLFGLLALCLDALAVAAQVMVGEAVGAGDIERARVVTTHLVRRSVVVGLALGATIAALSTVLPLPFSHDGDVRASATGVVALLGLLLVPGAVAFLYDGVCLGLGAFTFLRSQALSALAAMVPFLVALALYHRLGLPFLWLGLTVWMCARAAIQHVWFTSGRWLRSLPT
jgi:putative MATE family efflux protein